MSSSNQSTVSSNQRSSATLIEDDDMHRVCGCGASTRYVILVIATLYFSILMSSVIAYNATYVPMMNKKTSPLFNGTNANDTSIEWDSWDLSLSDQRFSYGFLEKSLSFAGVYAGSMTGTFLINALIAKFGAHKVMFVIGVISTILAAVTPIVVATSFPVFVIVRFLSGFSIANLFPVAGIIVNEWAATHEKGLFVAVLSAYVELSALFTMPLSGLIAANLGWPAVFYIHALACGVLTILWGLYYRDKPNKHPFVAAKEWRKISTGKLLNQERAKPPVARIMHTLSIWAVWIAVLGNYLVAQFSISFSTIYLTSVLDYTPVNAGLITIIPLTLLLLIKFITGLVSDRITCISELSKLKLFNSLALLGSGIFFIILSVFEPFGHVADVILIAIPISLLGFSVGGFPKAAVMVSRQHSPFVMSIVQIMAMIALMVGSFLVPALTTQDTFAAWRNVFIFYGAVLVVCNSIFIALAKAEPAKWSETVAPAVAAPQDTSGPPRVITPDQIV